MMIHLGEEGWVKAKNNWGGIYSTVSISLVFGCEG